ncbi:MAG: hypothetical protein ACOWWR_19125 [Eubacteriales bacterium]
MFKKLLALIIVTLMFFSCASTGFLMAKAKVTMYHEAYPPKEENAIIDVYRSNTPEVKYIEIAEVSCRDTDDNWAMKQILIKAREIGADGIIIIGRAGDYGVGVPIGNIVYSSTEGYGIKAIAIKYIEE